MAKHFKKILAFTLLLASLSACIKSPNHSIRIRNFYTQDMTDVKINSTSYGPVEAGITTEYKHVEQGNFIISGTAANGQVLNGSGTVEGRGEHNWTLTITGAGSVTFVKDK